MWVFPKPLEEVAEADLRALIRDGVKEGQALEFTREMYPRTSSGSKEMLREIIAFANAEGGVILIGMEEAETGEAKDLYPVPDATVEADRIIGSCTAGITERIPGLRVHQIPIAGGEVLAIHVPRSHRRPHMITIDDRTEFWIRHDRQRSPMSMGEIRAALRATEAAQMQVEALLRERREFFVQRGCYLALMASPILLEDGRIDIRDQALKRLLRTPPQLRGAEGVSLSDPDARIQPTVRGIEADSGDFQGLEVFRNGHIEFRVYHRKETQQEISGQWLLTGWKVAEYTWNFVHFVDAVRNLFGMADHYLVALSVLRCREIPLRDSSWGTVRAHRLMWDEADHLHLDPILHAMGDPPNRTARQLSDRVWNAFHSWGCPFFDEDDQLRFPDR